MLKLINDNIHKTLLYGYLLILSGFSFFIFPSHDILFYYYPWSQHLQLSYYDGPPLVAYIIRSSTFLFGHNRFALNFWGEVIAFFTGYAIIRIGEIIASREFGYIAALLWLVYPFATTRFIFVTLNYDCLDCLFCLLTVLFTLRYLVNQRLIDLYLISVNAGLLLLAKYTGIVLLLSILIFFILDRQARKIYQTPHFYLAALLCIAIFSPVLIWNYQHDWISFKYQLTTHNWSQGTYSAAKTGFSGVSFYLFTDVLGVLHVLILLFMFGIYKSPPLAVNQNKSHLFGFLWTICGVYFIFWLSMSYSSHVAMNYLLTPDSIFIILSSYYLYRANYKRLLQWLICLCLVLSLGMLVDRAFIKKIEDGDIIKYRSLNLSDAAQMLLANKINL